jgi:hypothetical protein
LVAHKKDENGNPMQYEWTEAIVSRLLQLRADGKFHGRIAVILNEEFPQRVVLTKNSITGKLTRLDAAKERNARRAGEPKPQKVKPAKAAKSQKPPPRNYNTMANPDNLRRAVIGSALARHERVAPPVTLPRLAFLEKPVED